MAVVQEKAQESKVAAPAKADEPAKVAKPAPAVPLEGRVDEFHHLRNGAGQLAPGDGTSPDPEADAA